MSLKLQLGIEQTPADARQAITQTLISKTIAQTDDEAMYSGQAIGTSWEAVTIHADITTPGFVVVHNLDATNFVELDVEATGANPVVKLKAGEWAMFRLATTTLYAQADTAACDIEYWVWAD